MLGDRTDPDLFHDIGPLQAEGAIDLGFDTLQRVAASSPGPVLPMVLRTLTDAVEPAPHGFRVELVDRPPDDAAESSWRLPAEELRDWLVEHHGDDGEVVAWLDDQELLSAWFDDGHVFEACVVAVAAPSPASEEDRRAVH